MPRYFFDCLDGGADIDTEGCLFDNDHAARVQAITLAGETLRDDPEHLDNGQALRIEVRDAKGDLLFTVVTQSVDAKVAFKA